MTKSQTKKKKPAVYRLYAAYPTQENVGTAAENSAVPLSLPSASDTMETSGLGAHGAHSGSPTDITPYA